MPRPKFKPGDTVRVVRESFPEILPNLPMGSVHEVDDAAFDGSRIWLKGGSLWWAADRFELVEPLPVALHDVETPEQVLSAAARLLEERGWCRFESEPNGPYTVDEAVELAANGDVDLAGRAIRVLAGWLICAEQGPTFWMGSARQVVTRWNDWESADKAAVLDALGRAAAARAEATGRPAMAWMARVLAECQARGEDGSVVSVKAVVELLRHEVPGGVNNNWTATFADWVVEQDPTLRVQRKRRAQ